MYISRNIDNILLGWKEAKNRKPLLLRGVRQCGKTSAVRELAKQFEVYIEINLEKQPNISKVFEKDIDVKKIISKIELLTGKRVILGKTLLFIDEIQECPRAITALRYFYEEMPELHVIAAGSLLEFVLCGDGKRGSVDFPVGRVRSIYMYPFSFMEFLKGIRKDVLYEYLENIKEFEEENLAHSELLEAYKTFLVVGGMPEAVSEYALSGSLLECQQIHRDIVLNFKDDFNKYSANISAEIIRKVFEFAMHNVCGQTKASSAIEGVSAYYFDECINLLRRAGLVYPVKASPCNTIPLGASSKETNKKLLVFDTGVYLTECGLNVGDMLGANVFGDLNKGNVVEMQTGLEIVKNGSSYSEPALFYWYRSGANAEIDYAIVKDNMVIPVEVKASGKGSMQSLHSFLNAHENSKYGIRISLENFSMYENIRVYPVYAVGKL
jgi:hypothetical protein